MTSEFTIFIAVVSAAAGFFLLFLVGWINERRFWKHRVYVSPYRKWWVMALAAVATAVGTAAVVPAWVMAILIGADIGFVIGMLQYALYPSKHPLYRFDYHHFFRRHPECERLYGERTFRF